MSGALASGCSMTVEGLAIDVSATPSIEADAAERHAKLDGSPDTPQFQWDVHRTEGEAHLLGNREVPPDDTGRIGRRGPPLHSGSTEVAGQECAICLSSLVSTLLVGEQVEASHVSL